MLVIENLNKIYHNAGMIIKALNNINLKVNPGEFISIIGRSGCGKSTLLQAIAGLASITSGSIHYTNADKKIAMIFQEDRLLPWLTVEKNIIFGLDRKLSQTEKLTRLNNVLELVKLVDYRQLYPNQLSGGMKQRVSIARSLIINPTLLLLDEPFSALDAFTKHKLQNELVNYWLNLKNSMIFVTHDVEEAILLGNKVIVMDQGTIKDMIEINLAYPRTVDDPYVVKTRKFLLNVLNED